MSAPLLDLLSVPTISPLSDLLSGTSRCAKLARLFIARRGQWIDSDQIARVAGKCAWRTRCSELRAAPWHLEIVNRQRRINDNHGGTFVQSEYRLV